MLHAPTIEKDNRKAVEEDGGQLAPGPVQARGSVQLSGADLQHAIGNAAMLRSLAQTLRAEQGCPILRTPQRCPFGGACHACPARIQAKLRISAPGDEYEQEADRVAEQVVAYAKRAGTSTPGGGSLMPARLPQRGAVVQRQPATSDNTIPDWREVHRKCRQQVFGSRTQLAWGGRRIPSIAAVNLIFQVTGTGADGYGPEDLATVWAIERNFVTHPPNHENPNGSVDIGPVQLNYDAQSPGMSPARQAAVFGTNLAGGETFNGSPRANLAHGWHYLRRHGHTGYNPGSKARAGAVAALLPELRRFFQCLIRERTVVFEPEVLTVPKPGAVGNQIQRAAAAMAYGPNPIGQEHTWAGPVPAIAETLRSPGVPLDPATRAMMEPQFDCDFGEVRIHTDKKADESAQSINARAYTVGSQIVFSAGAHAPGTAEGQRLLAHELAHVVQQRAAIAARPARATLIQRQLKYLEQVVGAEAERYLKVFDSSVDTIESTAKDLKAPGAAEIRQAVFRLRALRKAGKVTCWRTSGGRNYASWDDASGEVRLHIIFGGAATSQITVLHEGIHALLAKRYPAISRLYGTVLKRGGTTNEKTGVLLLKWKAWTEYWAYRRTAEYTNLRLEPALRQNAHDAAMAEPGVKKALRALADQAGESDFDPSTWTPPTRLPRSK